MLLGKVFPSGFLNNRAIDAKYRNGVDASLWEKFIMIYSNHRK